MKRLFCLVLISMCVLLTGCQEKKVQIPENASDKLMVSHLTEEKLFFVEGRNVEAVDLGVTIAGMTRAGESGLMFTTKDDGFLYTLDLESGGLRKLVHVGKGRNELLYNEETQHVYLAASQDDRIQIVDMHEEEVIKSIGVGDFPISMRMDPENENLFVVNNSSSSISVIDVNDYNAVKEFPVPNIPEGIWVDDSKLYVGGHGPVHGELNRYVYVFDRSNGEQTDRIEVGSMPVKLFSPKGATYLYAVSHGSHELHRIALKDYSQVDQLQVGANPYGINGENERIFVSNIDEGTISIIDTNPFQMKGEISIPGAPGSIVSGGGE
ncbi:hypothetical protein U0355_12665 [Salimicrobium sp. PL1-032A]|uniref:YncE family protein n=1 Tax=Salimicrobium sp. PL1-032A TaxID=3095364 RepID=UPI0032606920